MQIRMENNEDQPGTETIILKLWINEHSLEYHHNVELAVNKVKCATTQIRSLNAAQFIFSGFSMVCFVFPVISLTHTVSINASANCFCFYAHALYSPCKHYSSRVGLYILNASREQKLSVWPDEWWEGHKSASRTPQTFKDWPVCVVEQRGTHRDATCVWVLLY